jgi:hypothetical protein
MNAEFEKVGMRLLWPILRPFPIICLEVLSKITKIPTQNRLSLALHSNGRPPDFEGNVMVSTVTLRTCIICVNLDIKWTTKRHD